MKANAKEIQLIDIRRPKPSKAKKMCFKAAGMLKYCAEIAVEVIAVVAIIYLLLKYNVL